VDLPTLGRPTIATLSAIESSDQKMKTGVRRFGRRVEGPYGRAKAKAQMLRLVKG
jgi:hypothetical protein